MKIKMLPLVVLVLLSVAGFGQRLTIENTYEITLRNAGAIKNADDVKGYFFFYVSDKANKKLNKYTLKITDDKLKKLKDIEFEDEKDVTILNSAFNENDLLFKFHYLNEDKLVYRIYGPNGNLKYTYDEKIKPIISMGGLFKKAANEVENELKDDFYGELYPVEKKGFITKNLEKKGLSVTLKYFSATSNKQWSYTPTGGKYSGASYIGVDNKLIYLNVGRLSSLFDRNPESTIVGIDIETGVVKFEQSTYTSKAKLSPALVSVLNNGKKILFGEFFDTNSSIIKDKSLGFAFWEIDDNGNYSNEKQFPWSDAFGKSLNVSSSGKIEDFGYLFIHNSLQVKDGSIFLIGEGYKTTGGKTYTTDLILIKFDENFIFQEAKIYPKQSNPVDLDGGGAFMSNQAKGLAIKFDDKFDYAYTLLNGDHSSFSICYSNYVKNKDYKGITFNSITYSDGKITTDKINTKSDATISGVLPAKQGQVLIMDYYKKDKRLDIHFEKLN